MSNQNKAIIAAVVTTLVIAGGYFSQIRNSKPEIRNNSKSITYDCQEAKTAYTLLDETHEINAKDTSFGKQVIGIDGKNADESKEYWAFYVDDKLAPVGAETYLCQGSEKVQWKLEAF